MIQNIHGLIVGQEWVFLIIIGIVIAAIITSVRKMMKKKIKVGVEDDKPLENITDQNEKALSILKSRLAKGEISKEEYEKLKKEF